jgi:RHS repeat-associated protein
VNTANNQLVGYGYDANGNLTSLPGVGTLSYDVANRMVGGSGASYVYSQDGRRIYESDTLILLHFYGIDGRELGSYTPYINLAQGVWTFTTQSKYVYINGRLIQTSNATSSQVVVTDRLGSVRANGTGTTYRYYPFGEEYTATAAYKFGTYYRDVSGLDYAQHRYSSSIQGRFLTADPYRPADPGGWNRYAYVGNDPVNFHDPSGLYWQGVATGCFVDVDGVCDPSAPVDPCGVQAPYDVGSPYGFLPGLDWCVSHQPKHSANGNPPPLPPECSITIFERSVPFRASPGIHTYLEVTEVVNGIPIVDDVLESGPQFHPRHFVGNYGNMVG